MVLDDLRNYLQMASGLTEVTTSKAKDVVSGLVSAGLSLSTRAMPAPDMMGQVQTLADDLVATSRTNREMLVGMIRSEVDRAVGRMGFVREDELAALRRHVQRLEKQVDDLAAASPRASAPTPPAPAAAPQPAPTADAVDEAPKPRKKKKVIVPPVADR
ncbi:MAG: polyhydroxyalkanoate synthesis protein PhaF [Actinomycetota bacterium]|nr:polyhydroxyalkanoate synthesis protein PhaF [Actinomycetota bacterium]